MGRKADSVEPTSVTKRRVFVVGEGLTEIQYMEYFSQYHSESGHFVCEILDKNKFDRRVSDRNDLVDLAIGFVTYRKDGKYTPFYLISHIIGDYYEYRSRNGSPLSDRDLQKLSWIRKKLIKSIPTNREDSIEVIEDVDEVVGLVVKQLNREWDDKYLYESPDMSHPIRPSPGGRDKVFIIMDRDYDPNVISRSHEEY